MRYSDWPDWISPLVGVAREAAWEAEGEVVNRNGRRLLPEEKGRGIEWGKLVEVYYWLQ